MGLRLQKMREGWEHKKKERRYFIYQPIKSTENASYKSILMQVMKQCLDTRYYKESYMNQVRVLVIIIVRNNGIARRERNITHANYPKHQFR